MTRLAFKGESRMLTEPWLSVAIEGSNDRGILHQSAHSRLLGLVLTGRVLDGVQGLIASSAVRIAPLSTERTT